MKKILVRFASLFFIAIFFLIGMAGPGPHKVKRIFLKSPMFKAIGVISPDAQKELVVVANRLADDLTSKALAIPTVCGTIVQS